MSIKRRLALAEKAAAVTHDDGQYCEILEDPNFYGNADQLGWASIEPRILTHPDLKGTRKVSTLMRYLAEAIGTKRDLVEGRLPSRAIDPGHA